MMRTRISGLLAMVSVGALGACTSASGSDTAPTLTIVSPIRGATSDGGAVTVTGTVTDDGPVAVTVNGAPATVAADGSFTVDVVLPPGITVIETHAVDRDAHDVRDVRAVLAGHLVATDGTLAAPVAARADAGAIAAVGDAIATLASGVDFDAAVKAMNPIYNNGGCLGARVDVTSVQLGAIDVGLAPGRGALVTDVAIHDVVVKAHADFKAACIGGSTSITVTTTTARIHGDLGVGASGGALHTTLPDATVALDGFTIDVGGVPSAVESLLRTQVRDAVANALANIIKQKAPGMADQALAGLVAKPLAPSILGHATQIAIDPTAIAIDPATGLYVELSTTTKVDGGTAGLALATGDAMSPDVLAGAPGLGIAIADDTINQLLAGLWAAGAVDRSLPIASVGPLAALLDDDVATLDVHLALPPTVSPGTGDALALALGDLVVTGRDAAGGEVQTIALSLSTTLTAAPSQAGKLALAVGTPAVKAQVLVQTDVVDRPLTDAQVEGIVNGAWGLVGDTIGSALANVPMPSVAGVALGAPTVTGHGGFVVADLAVGP